MPKHYISFNLPEEREELRLAQKGIDYSIAIEDFSNYLRNLWKYPPEKFTKGEADLLDKIRAEFHQIMTERGVYDE